MHLFCGISPLPFPPFSVPQVLFNTTRIIVQERKDRPVLAKYTLKRRGYDLNSVTEVTLQSDTLPSDNATAGVDFAVIPLTKLVFQEGENLKTGVVEILPDSIREGRENFHIRIKSTFNGERVSPHALEVVILDAFEGK